MAFSSMRSATTHVSASSPGRFMFLTLGSASPSPLLPLASLAYCHGSASSSAYGGCSCASSIVLAGSPPLSARRRRLWMALSARHCPPCLKPSAVPPLELGSCPSALASLYAVSVRSSLALDTRQRPRLVRSFLTLRRAAFRLAPCSCLAVALDTCQRPRVDKASRIYDSG